MSAYERVLRLKHVRLRGWQRESLTWGLIVLSVLLALTGMVSPWGILVLPLLAAAVLKGHDLLTSRLAAGAPLPVGVTQPDRDSNEPPVTRTEGS